jgi:DNA-binding PadR family transcriptional regulator
MDAKENLGQFQQLVMLAVLRAGPDAYGARLQGELEETADRRVTISTIYVTLDRLEGKGLVRSWKGVPTPVRGGKARRFYELTPRGLDALRESRDVLDRMWEGADATDRAS